LPRAQKADSRPALAQPSAKKQLNKNSREA
jgi:hypothetical protein